MIDKELEKFEKYQLLKDETHCSDDCYWGPWSCISQL